MIQHMKRTSTFLWKMPRYAKYFPKNCDRKYEIDKDKLEKR